MDADVSEERAVSIIRTDLCRVKNWLSCVNKESGHPDQKGNGIQFFGT
jgi:hypothetical protein